MGIYFIVNPVAGSGRAKAFIKEVEPDLIKKGITYKIAYTNYPGHAIELAAQVNSSIYSKVVSVGGDGTLNEVLNGLELKKMTLGIIPAGTGNDLIKSLNIPKDEYQALEVVLEGRKMSIDIGTINHKRFINVSGVGLDVEVLRETIQLKKVFKGKASYILGVLKALVNFKSRTIELMIDGDYHREEIMLCAIGNGQYIGGGMKITPKADLEDGLLDICMVRRMPKLKLLVLFPKVFSGSHLGIPGVKYLRGKKVSIISPQNIWVNGDGELLQETTPTFTILEKSLNILVS